MQISKPIKLIGLAAAALLLSAGARAQTALTLKDALNYALQNSVDAHKAKLDVENGGYQIEETRARALPQVNGVGSLTDQYKKQKFVIDGALAGEPGKTLALESGTTWNAIGGVTLEQKLFDQSVFTGLKAAKTTEQYYKLSAELTDEQVIEQVATNYYNVLVQRQKLVVIDSNLRNTTRVHDIINGQYQNGLAKKIDLDRTSVNISNLRTQRQSIINAIQQQENMLKFYMGMPIQTVISIPQSEFDALQPKSTELPDNMEMSARTEFLVLRKQRELLSFQKDSYKAENYPSLSLAANYYVSGVSNQFVLFRNKDNGANWFGYGNVALNLKIPLFNGFATRARIRQADVSLRKNQEDLRNTELSLNLGYANARVQMSNSLVSLDYQKENVQLAQEVFSNTQNNYNNGLASLTDLLNAESDLTQARNNFASAILDYRLAEIQLIKSQGKLKSLLN